MTPESSPIEGSGGRHSFFAFAIVGGLAAGLNVVSRWLLSFVVPFEVAIVLAFVVGLTTAFFLNRAFVFERSGRSVASEAWRFLAVNLLALGQVWVIAVLLARWLFPAVNWTWHSELIAHTIAVLSPVVTSYYAHRLFTFGKAG